MENNNVAAFADSLAQALGFHSATQALNLLVEKCTKHDAHFMGAIQIVYSDHPDNPVANTNFLISDFIPEGDGASFYALSPAAGPDFSDHLKKLMEFGRSLKTPEDVMAVLADPSRCPVPVQREFHSVSTFSYVLFGVVNYKRDEQTNDITLTMRHNFTPIVDVDPTTKAVVGSGEKVTPLRPKK